MDLLDIAIVKQLAGGGGGSGTDNYNDLSNLPKINDTTLSGNKSSSALGLQSEINSDSKLASDLVDDTNQDNKFVTSTEKNTWNGKQNAIDADHKLSSDLVDDANKTNKFVTSTEKNTWNNKQNAIDSDHKLSSSLVSFTTAEAAALASGIDSSKVEQIGTNQTNIWYTLDKVGKNDFNFPVFAKDCEVSNGTKVITDESIKLTATSADCFTIPEYNSNVKQYPREALIPVNSGEKIVFSWAYTPHNSQTNDRVGIFGNGTYNQGKYLTAFASDGSLEYTVPSDVTYVTVRVGVATSGNSATYSEMMVSKKTAYDADPTYQPFSLPNYDLTQLQAEDRAALVEQVDEGAKNVLNTLDLAKIKALNSSGTWNNNIYTYRDVNWTVNSDGTITANGTPSAGLNGIICIEGYSTSADIQGMMISGIPNNDTFMSLEGYASPYTKYVRVDSANQEVAIPSFNERCQLYLGVTSGKTVTNATFKPMITTKAKLDVSKNYAQFALPNYDLTRLESEDRAGLVECVDGGAKNQLNVALDTIKGLNTGGTWTNNQYLNYGVTFTVNSDGTVTATGTADAQHNASLILAKYSTSTSIEGMVLSGVPNANGARIAIQRNSSPWSTVVYIDSGTSDKIIPSFNYESILFCMVSGGSTVTNAVFKPMLCTKAAFGVSNKFVPYRPNYDLVQFMLPKSKTVNFTVTTANTHQLVEDLKIDIPSGYAIQITATAWRANSVTPSAVRIYASGLVDISDNTVVAYNDSPVSGQLGLSTTGVIKNVGNTTIQAYTTIKCSSTGTYKVTIFYNMVTGTPTN